MIVLLAILVISLLVMIGMIYMKSVEVKSGRDLLFFNDKTDLLIERNIQFLKRSFRHWNFKTIRLLYNFTLEKVENLLINTYHYVRNRFNKQVDLVKGRGSLKEEKKDASFFLKNIEEHKNNLNNKEE